MAETIVPQAGAASRARPEITALADKIAQREAKIGIIGLGYVGMPLALTAAKAGFKVLGFDINGPRVVQINRGESFLSHITSEVMQAAIGSGSARGHERFRSPVGAGRDPDLRADAAHQAPRARPDLCRRHDRAGDRARICGPASSSSWNRPPIPARRARC